MNLQEFRRARLDRAMADLGAELVVATLPANIAYITGGYISVNQSVMARNEAAVAYVPATGKVVYIVGYAELPSVLEFAGPAAEVYCYGGAFSFASGDSSDFAHRIMEERTKAYASSAEAWIAAICANTVPGSTVALDESRVFASVLDRVKAKLTDYSVIDGGSVLMKARRVKHPEEIAGIERSAQIAINSLTAVLSGFQPGVSAYDIWKQYNRELAARNATPYFCVITAGQRAAFSDTTNDSAPIEAGDMIRFDFGCIAGGYCSDLARTAFVGSPDEKVKTYYAAVKAGQEAAIAAVRPGATCRDIFHIACETTRRYGISNYSRHHCGHGIGLETYDMPSVAENDAVMEENMTFCIETPYYEIGWGGVQIEDTIAVEANGARLLEDKARELILL